MYSNKKLFQKFISNRNVNEKKRKQFRKFTPKRNDYEKETEK